MRNNNSKIFVAALLPILMLVWFGGNSNAQTYKDCMRMVNFQDWNNALECVKKLQDEKPDWYYPVYLQAKINRGLGKDDDALELLKEATDLASGDDELFPIFYEYTHFYYTRWRDKNDQKKAEDFCVQTKSVASKAEFQPRIYSICGKIAFRLNDFKSAEKDLKRAYDLDRNNPDTAELYIRTLMRLGKEKEAFEVLKKAPKNPNTYALLAEVYIKSGQFKTALETTEACLKMDRQYTKCMILGADAQIGLKDWDESVKLLQRYTIMRPKDWLGNQKLGDVYMQKRDFNNALEYLVRSVENTPLTECSPFISLAIAYENQFLIKNKDRKFIDAALNGINEALRRSPGNGIALEVRERIQKRIDDLKRPDQIEVNCDDPKNKNLPACIQLLEEERLKKLPPKTAPKTTPKK
jgi:tetratricopeptide (TPR) repeat protein